MHYLFFVFINFMFCYILKRVLVQSPICWPMSRTKMSAKITKYTEVYDRLAGYFFPVCNNGKRNDPLDRKEELTTKKRGRPKKR